MLYEYTTLTSDIQDNDCRKGVVPNIEGTKEVDGLWLAVIKTGIIAQEGRTKKVIIPGILMHTTVGTTPGTLQSNSLWRSNSDWERGQHGRLV